MSTKKSQNQNRGPAAEKVELEKRLDHNRDAVEKAAQQSDSKADSRTSMPSKDRS